MKTFPLQSLSIQEAMQTQFRLVDAITRHFSGDDILTCGDLGVKEGLNRPMATSTAEEVLSDFFGCEAAMFVRGAGTGALRMALFAVVGAGGRLLLHDAPIYPTTKTSIEMMGINVHSADFNDYNATREAVLAKSSDAVLIQATRQKPDDSYNLEKLIEAIRSANAEIPIITDDNYAALKTPHIGTQIGGTLATFSCFKLLGPEGVGVIVGEKKWINKLREHNYSGGSQVQGHEAIEALRGMIYAPVALAISAQVTEEVAHRLNQGEIGGIDDAFVVNAQSKVVIVRLKQPIARAVLQAARKFGAAPHPVGAESKYEFVPMLYQASGTFRAADPDSAQYMLRINPMRAGADTVIRILAQAMKEIEQRGQ